MNKLKLLLTGSYNINDKIRVTLPKIGEINDYGEEKYFKLISNLVSIPSEMKSTLWDSGIDYEKLSDLEMFYILTRNLKPDDTKIILNEEIDLSSMNLFHNAKTDLLMMSESTTLYEAIKEADREGALELIEETFTKLPTVEVDRIKLRVDEFKCGIVLPQQFEETFGEVLDMEVPKKGGVVIDMYIHMILNDCLREAHGIKERKKAIELAATEGTKRMLIMADRDDREKAARMYKTYGYQSNIEPIVIALVNSSDFPYDYQTVQDISFYTIIKSVKQVSKLKQHYFTMLGIYSGTIDQKSVVGRSKSALEWIPSTKNS